MLIIFIICLVVVVLCLAWIRNIVNEDIRKYEAKQRKRHLKMMERRNRMSKSELRDIKINELFQ